MSRALTGLAEPLSTKLGSFFRFTSICPGLGTNMELEMRGGKEPATEREAAPRRGPAKRGVVFQRGSCSCTKQLLALGRLPGSFHWAFSIGLRALSELGGEHACTVDFPCIGWDAACPETPPAVTCAPAKLVICSVADLVWANQLILLHKGCLVQMLVDESANACITAIPSHYGFFAEARCYFPRCSEEIHHPSMPVKGSMTSLVGCCADRA